MASQPRLMIAGGVLKDYVNDVSAYIDSLEDSQKLTELTAQLMADDAESNHEDVFKAIAEKSDVISKANEEDYEPAYNLVLHILSFSSKLTELVPIVLKNLTHIPSYGPVPTLMVLSNLFNILPESSPLRYQVFDQLVDTATKAGSLQQLDLAPLPKWLLDWNCSAEQRTNLLKKIVESLNDQKASLAVLTESLKECKTLEGTSDLAEFLLNLAINDSITYDFDSILALPAVMELSKSGSSAYKTAFSINNGEYSAVSGEDVIAKAKIRALAAFASKSITSAPGPASAISYSAIATAISVEESMVERWIIDAIKAGVLEGRMSQLNQSFTAHRAQPVGDFTAEDWNLVQAKLSHWKNSLKEVLDVIQNAKDSAKIKA